MPRKTRRKDWRPLTLEEDTPVDLLSDSFDAASTDDGYPTPSESSDATMTNERHVPGEEAVPGPDETFIIQLRETQQAITLEDGRLKLCNRLNPEGGYHWRCEEKDGWLGFRNCVSGTYIGHDGKKKFIAKVSHHRDHEYFCVRPHPKRGGYELLMRHGMELWRMDVGEDGETLVEKQKGEGATWDFFKTTR